MAFSSHMSYPMPWLGVTETISDTASEPDSLPQSLLVSEIRDTLSGRWGWHPFFLTR